MNDRHGKSSPVLQAHQDLFATGSSQFAPAKVVHSSTILWAATATGNVATAEAAAAAVVVHGVSKQGSRKTDSRRGNSHGGACGPACTRRTRCAVLEAHGLIDDVMRCKVPLSNADNLAVHVEQQGTPRT